MGEGAGLGGKGEKAWGVTERTIGLNPVEG